MFTKNLGIFERLLILATAILVSGVMSSQLEAVEDPAHSASVKLAWDLSWEPDIAGYRVHYGPESGVYTESVDVGYQIKADLSGLTVGATYYSAVTAYNDSGLESPFSNEISFTATAPGQEIDTDQDGLSDFFESNYGGEAGLDPLSDLDGDGLSALAEFAHGLNPTQKLSMPLFTAETLEMGEERYLCVSYFLDPQAQAFVAVRSERCIDCGVNAVWNTGETVQVSSTPSEEHPGLLKIVERSLSPMSAQPREFLRFRYEVVKP